MPIERTKWKNNFSPEGLILWPCPACHLPTLSFVPDTLPKTESRKSLSNHDDAEWEPDWIEARFVCLLKCKSCNESISVAGKQGVRNGTFYNADEDEYEDEYFDFYEPYFVSPAHQ
jgi:hypothetical protein